MDVSYKCADQVSQTDDYILEQIVGVSRSMRDLREEIRHIAQFAVNVLVTGPTGTGKEIVARTVHKLSSRRNQPFIPVDCAAVTGTLFASHMFGHLKGSFTGASHSALGCFRAAQNGTIFLDEIGEMELSLQAKLLRVLQQNAVVPVGGHDEVPVDVRVVAATNRDLIEEVHQGRFREDLFYRLNIVHLHLPSLAERAADIPVLAAHFLAELAVRHGSQQKRLSEEALALMVDYAWPGNIRQLQNVLERLTLLPTGPEITPHEVSAALELHQRNAVGSDEYCNGYTSERQADSAHMPWKVEVNQEIQLKEWYSLEEVEKHHIESALKLTYYNQSAAAELLDMDRSALRRKISKFNLDLPRPKRGRPRKPR